MKNVEMVEQLGFVPGAIWSPMLAGTEFFGGILLLIGFLTRPGGASRRTIVLLVTVWFHWVLQSQGVLRIGEVDPEAAITFYFVAHGGGPFSSVDRALRPARSSGTSLPGAGRLRAAGAVWEAYCGLAQLRPIDPMPMPASVLASLAALVARRRARAARARRTSSRSMRSSSRRANRRPPGSRASKAEGVRGRRLPRARDGARRGARRAADRVAARHRVRQPPDPVRRADRARLRRVRVRAVTLTRLPARAAEV